MLDGGRRVGSSIPARGAACAQKAWFFSVLLTIAVLSVFPARGGFSNTRISSAAEETLEQVLLERSSRADSGTVFDLQHDALTPGQSLTRSMSALVSRSGTGTSTGGRKEDASTISPEGESPDAVEAKAVPSPVEAFPSAGWFGRHRPAEPGPSSNMTRRAMPPYGYPGYHGPIRSSLKNSTARAPRGSFSALTGDSSSSSSAADRGGAAIRSASATARFPKFVKRTRSAAVLARRGGRRRPTAPSSPMEHDVGAAGVSRIFFQCSGRVGVGVVRGGSSWMILIEKLCPSLLHQQ